MAYYKTEDGKLVPRQKVNWHPKATTPASDTEVDRPMKIYVTGSMRTTSGNVESVQMKFGSGSAYVNMGSMTQGLYELQPIAWKTNGDDAVPTGAIVFIYQGGQ